MSGIAAEVELNDDVLADLSVAAHIMQNQLAAVTMAATMLPLAPFGAPEQQAVLQEVLEHGAMRLQLAIGLLERGLPSAALAELTRESLPRVGTPAPGPDYPVAEREDARVAALSRYQLLDRSPVTELEAIARVAAAVSGASSAVINLIDSDRQWPAAASGLDRVEVPRHDAMCNLTVATGRAVVVPDARVDSHFATSPWVTGQLGRVRLYVSLPLVTPEAHAIGSLCVVDDDPIDLPDAVIETLTDLAVLAMAVMEGRLAALELRQLLLYTDI